MRRLLLALAIVAPACSTAERPELPPPAPPAAVAVATPDFEPLPLPPKVSPATTAPGDGAGAAAVIVFGTTHGTKYHVDGCRYLNKSRIPVPLDSAARRLAPCSVCKPPLPAG
jgi:hypothetical protein